MTVFIPFLLQIVNHSSLLDVGQQLCRRVLAVALGVVRDPAPEVIASLFHCELRLPLQLLVSPRRVGSQVQDVALSSILHLVREISADDLAEGLDDLENGAPATGSQVPLLNTGLVVPQVVQSHQVTLGQVNDMDVVTDSRAVARRVVCDVPR